MWLINCRTFTLEELVDPSDVSYAILSHTWEEGQEVSHREFSAKAATHKRGWAKIRTTCELALSNGCDYAWVDTCSIDKTSSAELSEAINSMFDWYAASHVCFVYLSDCDTRDGLRRPMADSRWFRRGWTLQELIAPNWINFYSQSWEFLGTKQELLKQLSAMTEIPCDILLPPELHNDSMQEVPIGDVGELRARLSGEPVARRMAWAAKRETTRIEDVAYSLLGLFAVNMPLLYGEGERAFVRLQEEIIKQTNDLSIFAWKQQLNMPPHDTEAVCGIFAPHPWYFKHATNYQSINDFKFLPDFTSTNKGLKMESQLAVARSQGLHVLYTNCVDSNDDGGTIGIYLKHEGASVFSRALPRRLAWEKEVIGIVEKKSFFLKKNSDPTRTISRRLVVPFFYLPRPSTKLGHIISSVEPCELWDDMRQTFITAGLHHFVGYYRFRVKDEIEVIVIFGFGYGHEPWVRVGDPRDLPHLNNELQRQSWRSVANIACQYLTPEFDTATPLGVVRTELETVQQKAEVGHAVRLNVIQHPAARWKTFMSSDSKH